MWEGNRVLTLGNRHKRFLRTHKICNSEVIVDKCHFILICSYVLDLKIKYIKKSYYSKLRIFKVITLLQLNNKFLLNICLFLKEVFNRRSEMHI